jgi:alkylation response protein AidB-like acyl-CoA dehydrogenase
VREVLAAECRPGVVHQAMTDPQCWRALWKTVVELGWTTLAGDDFGVMDVVVVLEECGAALAPIPMLSSVGLAGGVLGTCASAFGDLLAEVQDGAVAVLAAQTTDARIPRPPMTLVEDRVQGRAVGVCDLARAELIVTFAACEERTVAVILRPGPGVHISQTASIDPTVPLADLEVDTVAEATAAVDFEAAMTVPLIAAAAELVGVARAALTRAVEHARTRVQFGKPIGSFQGVKHALADGCVAVERARSLTYAAAAGAAHAANPAATWRSAALAKAAATEAALCCSRSAVQVHGAIGQTWEHDLHLYTRRAWQAGALLGDSRALYHEVGQRFLLGGAA